MSSQEPKIQKKSPAESAGLQPSRARQSGYAVSPADGSPIFYSITEPRRSVGIPCEPFTHLGVESLGSAATGTELAGSPTPPGNGPVRSPAGEVGSDDAWVHAPGRGTLAPNEPDEPAGTVVLCDGIGCDGYVWKYLGKALASRYRVIHWHYRGHGRTPRPRDACRVTIADHADDLVCILDECGVRDAVVFGHSMGVQVALETYRRHSARVTALCLLCGAPGRPLRTFQHTDRLEALLPRVRRMVRRAPWLFNRASRALLPTRMAYSVATRMEANGELLDPVDFMPYLHGMSRVDIELFLDMLNAANEHSAEDLLAHIAVPVLIVAGTRDGFTPASLSVRMHETIAGSELLMIEDGSHTAPLERPEQVNHTVLDFLARRLLGELPELAAGIVQADH